jgi:hypothetical protein
LNHFRSGLCACVCIHTSNKKILWRTIVLLLIRSVNNRFVSAINKNQDQKVIISSKE